jgi:ABC-type nitrate/sulfonate/bicarbonate transport system substrate-binding protein
MFGRPSRPAAVLAAVGLALVVAAGCGGADGESGGESGGGGVAAPRVAFTSEVQASYVNTRYGPVTFGKDFGIPMAESDFQVFDSHATATQTALSGRADIVGGSFVSHVLVRQAGQDFKVFCPFVSLDDVVLVGRNGVDSIDDLFRKETRAAVDSPGGAGAMILNAMLGAANAPGTVEQLPNKKIIESSGLRTTAFASDEVDATVIHIAQYNQAKSQVPDAKIISSLYEDVPVYIKEAFAASTGWLKEHKESAAAFCASILKANAVLKKDYGTFTAAVKQFVDKPPSETELQELFALIGKYDFWPTDGGLSEDAVSYMVQLAVTSKVLDKPVDAKDIVDREVLNRAVELAKQKG